eukprot:TRINITY_DN73138_c0_g1_i1.p2 TRINITY_DN73138_c0_g1~~TRINITY_DN73138_c0_g1_i1.p2  ORF type:complete len:258 (+),score=133.59 TRINITY_DN73138_c0_g1_i1:99-872(+)
MSAEKTPVDTPLEEDFNEEERLLLESHIKKNTSQEPQQFTVLYYLISVFTVGIICFLFVTVLDLSPLEPLNAVLYILSAAATAYFLAESYQSMYETESTKALTDGTGKWVKELEAHSQVRGESIKNKDKVKNTPRPAQLRTVQDIFSAHGRSAGEWRDLSKVDKQVYYDMEAAEEVAFYEALVAELRLYQYQKSMGWALVSCNLLFIGASLVISQLLLRNYDARVNLVISTIVTGLLTSLMAKQADEAASAAAKKKN